LGFNPAAGGLPGGFGSNGIFAAPLKIGVSALGFFAAAALNGPLTEGRVFPATGVVASNNTNTKLLNLGVDMSITPLCY